MACLPSIAMVSLSVLLVACEIGGAPLVDPAIAGMGCEQSERFAFSGETTLATIGLGDDFGGGRDSQRTGMVWVTADPVSLHGPGPLPPGGQFQVERMVCVQWPDGSGMAGPVPPGWEPPSAFDAVGQSDGSGPPLVLIGLLVAAGLIIGVSYLAFREERR